MYGDSNFRICSVEACVGATEWDISHKNSSAYSCLRTPMESSCIFPPQFGSHNRKIQYCCALLFCWCLATIHGIMNACLAGVRMLGTSLSRTSMTMAATRPEWTTNVNQETIVLVPCCACIFHQVYCIYTAGIGIVTIRRT